MQALIETTAIVRFKARGIGKETRVDTSLILFGFFRRVELSKREQAAENPEVAKDH